MNSLIAFDSFKGSLHAKDACEITKQAILEQHPQQNIDCCPLSDGGEGFTSILTESAGGDIKKTQVYGPLGNPTEALWGLIQASKIPSKTQKLLKVQPTNTLAVIEMAQASGLPLVPENLKNPWKSTTYGVGELLHEASKANVQSIILGLGGSATSDLGIGALQALGLQPIHNNAIINKPITPEAWTNTLSFNNQIHNLPPIKIATDVTNPLTGPNGAAAIFGPQKGLKKTEIKKFDKLLELQALNLCKTFNKPNNLVRAPGAGAAGGLAFGLKVAYDAEILEGFNLVSSWLDLENKVKQADLIITGEGKFDLTSLQGKGPGSLLKMAQKLNKPTLILAGNVDPAIPKILKKEYPLAKAIPITPKNCDIDTALKNSKFFLIKSIQKHLAS